MGSRMLEAHEEFIAECKEMLTDKWTGGLSSGASTTADSTVFQLPVPQVPLPEYVSPVTKSLIAKLHEAVGHIHTVSTILEGEGVDISGDRLADYNFYGDDFVYLEISDLVWKRYDY